jgi:hypothetical protein
MRRGAPLGSMLAALVASIVLATAALLARSTTLAPPPATLVDLRGPSELRAAFNNDRGHLRVVLLLSPT